MAARVLVVDAGERQIEALRGTFSPDACSWDVHFVETCAVALELMAASPADVIVAEDDQLLTEVRRRYPDTARLVLSSKADASAFTSAVGLAHQFMRKPCAGRELQDAIERALRLRDQFDDGDILRGDVSQLAVLPSPSPVFRDLVALIDSSAADARAVAAILERDVGLAAKVLQIVNSSFFAPRSRVTSLDVAVVRLGLRVLRSLILVEEVQREFSATPAVHAWIEKLNGHGYEAGRLARNLATGADRDDAFCAGLLHECGQLVFARSRPGVFAAHLGLRNERCASLSEVELETFGFTHAQAGGYLLSLWGFPPEVVDAVAHHDEMPHATAAHDLRWITQVANKAADFTYQPLCGPPVPTVTEEWFAEMGVGDAVAEWAVSEAS
ncbi:MAG TPA: response regulator [Acidimicrobiales bacterium]|nr:response regulator [Acidimicrobiales bacterium]